MNKCLIILLLLIFNLYSIASSTPLVNARSAIVVDYHSDKVLYEYEADTQIYPASMTKIMTSIIAFDLIEKNKISPNKKSALSSGREIAFSNRIAIFSSK